MPGLSIGANKLKKYIKNQNLVWNRRRCTFQKVTDIWAVKNYSEKLRSSSPTHSLHHSRRHEELIKYSNKIMCYTYLALSSKQNLIKNSTIVSFLDTYSKWKVLLFWMRVLILNYPVPGSPQYYYIGPYV